MLMVDIWILIESIALLVLLGGSAFFSSSETALFKLSKHRVQQLIEQEKKNASSVKKLKDNPNKMLITILIGNNLVNIAASSIATKLAIDLFGNVGVGIATGIMTFLILLFGEITPKSYAVENSVKHSLTVAKPIIILSKILYPVIKILNFLSKIVYKISGANLAQTKPYITEDEIKSMVKIGEKEGVVEKDEKEMIQSIFKFSDTIVKEEMVPRVDMISLPIDSEIDKALKVAEESGYSRIPVYKNKMDNIKGILYTKDLLMALRQNDEKSIDLKDLIRSPIFVPETKKIDELLKVLQRERTHMAIVIDEFGGVEGLITLEDVLEEIVGEIFDEYDEGVEPIEEIQDGEYLVDARMNVDDVNENLNINIPEKEYETISGFILSQLGRTAEEGDKIEYGNLSIIIESVKDHKILKVQIKTKKPEDEKSTEK